MAGFSTFYAQKCINDHFVTGSAKYLALFVADPTDANLTANEASGAWYARQAIGSWAAPVGAGTLTSNSNAVTFPAVENNAITVTHWGIYDALSGGNMWASGEIKDSSGNASPKVLNVDDVFITKAGELSLDFQ
jgi:hypothetical protein